MFVHDRGKLVITLVGVAFSVTLVFAQVGLNTPGPCAQSHTTGQLS